MRKIAIIGHFGFGENLLNGQTIKTKMLTKALNEQLGEGNISCIDTHGGIKKIIKIIIDIYSVFKKHSDIIMLPAHNGILIFTPMLSLFNKFAKKKLHYVVIGGWLPEYLDKHKNVANMLRKNFLKIYVETNGMKKKLADRNFKNVDVMPNFKNLNINNELNFSKEKPYKFCTFSRVMYEKGIEDAINVIKRINEESGEICCSLDIYGQIDSEYEQTFEELKKKFPQYIRYCGCVEAQKSGEVLKSYYALLFPTFYAGEGFAGTIIDAFAAGIPVIASDWRYNAEIVKHMETGIIYPHKNIEELKKSILIIINDSELLKKMKENCVCQAKNYLPETVINILIKNIAY